MNTTYRVLIIEDEPMIVENYERALEQVATNNASLNLLLTGPQLANRLMTSFVL